MKKAQIFHIDDEKWTRINTIIPEHMPGTKGGRPRADDGMCFEGILWVLRTGAQWSELPKVYGSGTICWR